MEQQNGAASSKNGDAVSFQAVVLSEKSRGNRDKKLKPYTLYLLSDHWTELRKWKLALAGATCSSCGRKDKLHVHHIWYRHLIDCTPEDLMVLCESCHNDVHLIAKRTGIPVESINESNVVKVVHEFRQTQYAKKRQAKINAELLAKQKREKDRVREALGYKARRSRLWVAIKNFVRRSRKESRIPGVEREFAEEIKRILNQFGYYPP